MGGVTHFCLPFHKCIQANAMKMKRKRGSEKEKSSLVTVTDNIDRDRLSKVRVKLRKIRLEELGPYGTVKLTKNPFVRLKKLHIPRRLLDDLKKEYSVGGRYRKKLKVLVIPDSQTVLIEEISSYDCVFQRKTKDV